MTAHTIEVLLYIYIGGVFTALFIRGGWLVGVITLILWFNACHWISVVQSNHVFLTLTIILFLVPAIVLTVVEWMPKWKSST